ALDVTDLDVGAGVGRLELDGTGPGPAALARVIVRTPVIGPVGDLEAVDPGGEVRAPGDDGQGERLEIAADQPPRILAVVDRPGGISRRARRIASLATVVDLRLVAHHEQPRLAAEEDAAVGISGTRPGVD